MLDPLLVAEIVEQQQFFMNQRMHLFLISVAFIFQLLVVVDGVLDHMAQVPKELPEVSQPQLIQVVKPISVFLVLERNLNRVYLRLSLQFIQCQQLVQRIAFVAVD